MNIMNFESESRRGSRSRALERSLSYSEAIGSNSHRSSIEIPSIVHSDVYTNEELKKHYRLSQTYVEGKEIAFPSFVTNIDTTETIPSVGDDGHTDAGLVMSIDMGTASADSASSPRTDTTRPLVSSAPTGDLYDTIQVDDRLDQDTVPPSAHGYSTPYTKRKKKTTHRRRHGRPRRSRRVVCKNGEENVPVRSNIPSKSIKYLRDVVNTVINSKWRFLILLMVVCHFALWLFFAGIWYAVTTSYQEDIGDGKQHCVTGTNSFAGMLMMAVETQMTIGYGVRYPNEECPEAIIVMVLEIVAGTALSGGLSSLLFTKLVRPNKHVSSVGFSKKAAVCLRDGQLCLQFRVWDLLNLHLVGGTITAYMLKPIRTLEGELVHNYIHQLQLSQHRAFLLWPLTVAHTIGPHSPLYDFSAQDMMDYRFEIVVCLTGSSKNMGTVTQSRTSYLSKEIIWGYRFCNVLKYSKSNEAYVIDVDKLNSVEQVETPLCSARSLREYQEYQADLSLSPTNMSLSRENSSTPSSPSSPSLNRAAGTQRSFGWNFKRFQPERYLPTAQN